jgi:hypothetical protein
MKYGMKNEASVNKLQNTWEGAPRREWNVPLSRAHDFRSGDNDENDEIRANQDVYQSVELYTAAHSYTTAPSICT